MTTLTFEQIERIVSEYLNEIAAAYFHSSAQDGYKIIRDTSSLYVLYTIVHMNWQLSIYKQWQYRISQLENGVVVYGPVVAIDPIKYPHGVVVCNEIEQRIRQGEERAAAAAVAPAQQQTAFTRPDIKKRKDDVKFLFWEGKTNPEIAKAVNVSESTVKNDLKELGLKRHKTN